METNWQSRMVPIVCPEYFCFVLKFVKGREMFLMTDDC